MSYIRDAQVNPTASPDMVTLLVSLEMSRSKWLVTSLSPVSAKMSRHNLKADDALGLLALLGRLRGKLEEQIGTAARVIVIQEAGLDGFWLHRYLMDNQIESHVVDAASVAMPRRRRRAKTDRIDGEVLVRTLAAWRRDEPRVCSMVVPPSPLEEDRRRINRERAALVAERIRQSNRIRGLLLSQGASDYDPLRRNRRERLDQLTTGDGRPLGAQLKKELLRALDRLELLLEQVMEVEKERDAILVTFEPAVQLQRLCAVGPQFATVLAFECFYRHFDNRRQVAAYAGLSPSPWQSGQVSHDQGISKAGNPRLRITMLEMAWLWLRYQPGSALSRWFQQRVTNGQQPGQRRSAIIALARKLLIALWRYVKHGILPEGALLKAA